MLVTGVGQGVTVTGVPVGVGTTTAGVVLAEVAVAVTMVAGQTVVPMRTVEVMIFWVREAGQLGTDAAQLVMVYTAVLVTVLVIKPGAEVTDELP